MIIDLILDRKEDEKEIAQGFTHYKNWKGEILPLAYDAKEFYNRVIEYGEIGWEIASAMDCGTEEEVKAALCDYVLNNEYNPAICDFINSCKWLPEEE